VAFPARCAPPHQSDHAARREEASQLRHPDLPWAQVRTYIPNADQRLPARRRLLLLPRGGHLAEWEVPELIAAGIYGRSFAALRRAESRSDVAETTVITTPVIHELGRGSRRPRRRACRSATGCRPVGPPCGAVGADLLGPDEGVACEPARSEERASAVTERASPTSVGHVQSPAIMDAGSSSSWSAGRGRPRSRRASVTPIPARMATARKADWKPSVRATSGFAPVLAAR
jgi:hypothetical protein